MFVNYEAAKERHIDAILPELADDHVLVAFGWLYVSWKKCRYRPIPAWFMKLLLKRVAAPNSFNLEVAHCVKCMIVSAIHQAPELPVIA